MEVCYWYGMWSAGTWIQTERKQINREWQINQCCFPKPSFTASLVKALEMSQPRLVSHQGLGPQDVSVAPNMGKRRGGGCSAASSVVRLVTAYWLQLPSEAVARELSLWCAVPSECGARGMLWYRTTKPGILSSARLTTLEHILLRKMKCGAHLL